MPRADRLREARVLSWTREWEGGILNAIRAVIVLGKPPVVSTTEGTVEHNPFLQRGARGSTAKVGEPCPGSHCELRQRQGWDPRRLFQSRWNASCPSNLAVPRAEPSQGTGRCSDWAGLLQAPAFQSSRRDWPFQFPALHPASGYISLEPWIST